VDAQKDKNLYRYIQECQAGDSEAFHELYKILQKPIFGFIVARTNSRQESLDLLQDVFIDLWKALPKFRYRSDKEFYSFVFLVTRRKLANYYKTKPEIVTFSEEYMTEVYEEPTEDLSQIRKVLNKLKPKYREIIELRYWSDLSFRQIAEYLDAKETTVKVRHHRAIEKLNSLLDNNA